MKIYFYCLPLNEMNYAHYMIEGLRLNGHQVVVKSKNSSIVDEIQYFKSEKFDLILFMGFSFMNHIQHQSIDHRMFLPHLTNTPYAVMFYDDPRRYIYELDYYNDGIYFCCDSILCDELSHLNFIYNPCTFDSRFSYPRPRKNHYQQSFCGSVFNASTLDKIKQGLSHRDLNLIASIKHTKHQYFDYIEWIKKNGPFNNRQQIIQLLLMTEKHRLRMDLFEVISANTPLDVFGQGDYQPENQNIIKHGNLDQHSELQQCYADSDISYTVELLPGSVHQRIFECFGSGGFMLCEAKKDMYTVFPQKLAKSILWENGEDLKEKSAFYLKNESARNSIGKEVSEHLNKYHINTERAAELIRNIDSRL